MYTLNYIKYLIESPEYISRDCTTLLTCVACTTGECVYYNVYNVYIYIMYI